MDVLNTADILRQLRERLVPIEVADTLFDTVEGLHPHALKAAVLLPLFEQESELSLTFIRRATTLRAHSGQIAFPGGKKDPEDLFPVVTALREAQEEIGLDPQRAEVLGVLPPVFTVMSNYLIMPVVAFLPHGLGHLHLQTSEVSELILASVRGLADPAIAHTEQWSRQDITRTVYFYQYGPHQIWGATGRILSLLLETLGLGNSEISDISPRRKTGASYPHK
jgi:8-oxo-dGTP pyrophosphatase MutT (NUDIX family)